jgi:hypothetical protein
MSRNWEGGGDGSGETTLSRRGDEERGDSGEGNRKRTFRIKGWKKPSEDLHEKAEDVSDGRWDNEILLSPMKLDEDIEKKYIPDLGSELESISSPVTTQISQRTSLNSDYVENLQSCENYTENSPRLTGEDSVTELLDPVLTNTINLCQNWCCFEIFFQNSHISRNHWRATCSFSCAISLGKFRKKYE